MHIYLRNLSALFYRWPIRPEIEEIPITSIIYGPVEMEKVVQSKLMTERKLLAEKDRHKFKLMKNIMNCWRDVKFFKGPENVMGVPEVNTAI